MPIFTIYEIWTSARRVEAATIAEAYQKGEPAPRKELSLSNWHVAEDQPTSNASGGLNYRQED